MCAARVVQMAVDDVIHVASMRHRRMIAFRPMNVIRGMTTAVVAGRASAGVDGVDVERVLFDGSSATVGVLEASVEHVVFVPPVTDGGVPAARAVGVKLPLMIFVITHALFFSILGRKPVRRSQPRDAAELPRRAAAKSLSLTEARRRRDGPASTQSLPFRWRRAFPASAR